MACVLGLRPAMQTLMRRVPSFFSSLPIDSDAGAGDGGWLASLSGRGVARRKSRGKGGLGGPGAEVPRAGLRPGWYAHDGAADNRTGNRKRPPTSAGAED